MNRTPITIPFYLIKNRIIPFFVTTITSYIMFFILSDINVVVKITVSAFIVLLITYNVEKLFIKNPIVNEIDHSIRNFLRNR